MTEKEVASRHHVPTVQYKYRTNGWEISNFDSEKQ